MLPFAGIICMVSVTAYSSADHVPASRGYDRALVVCEDGVGKLVVDSAESAKTLEPVLRPADGVAVDPHVLRSIDSSMRPALSGGKPATRNMLIYMFCGLLPFGLAIVFAKSVRVMVNAALAVVVLETVVLLSVLLVTLVADLSGQAGGSKGDEHQECAFVPPGIRLGGGRARPALFVAAPRQASADGFRCAAADVFRRCSGGEHAVYRGTHEGFMIGSPDADRYLPDGLVVTKLVARQDGAGDVALGFHELRPHRGMVYSRDGARDELLIRSLCGGILLVILSMAILRRRRRPGVFGMALLASVVLVFSVNVLVFLSRRATVDDSETVSVPGALESLEKTRTRLARLVSDMSPDEFGRFADAGWDGLPGLLSDDGVGQGGGLPMNPYTGRPMRPGRSPGNYWVFAGTAETGGGNRLCTYDIDGREYAAPLGDATALPGFGDFDRIFSALTGDGETWPPPLPSFMTESAPATGPATND